MNFFFTLFLAIYSVLFHEAKNRWYYHGDKLVQFRHKDKLTPPPLKREVYNEIHN